MLSTVEEFTILMARSPFSHQTTHMSPKVKYKFLQVSAWCMQRRVAWLRSDIPPPRREVEVLEGTNPPLEAQQRSWALAQGHCIPPAPASPHWVVAACP